jgi:hypothetical protein
MTLKQKFWTARIIMGIALMYVLSLGLPNTHHQNDGERAVASLIMAAGMVVMVHYSKKLRAR